MDSPRICEWQNKIVRNTLSAGHQARPGPGDRASRRRLRQGRRDEDAPRRISTEECRNAFHDTSKELALIWHKEAQRTKNQDTYELDKYVYKVFLDHFPKDKDAYEMGFYYGELLWTLENWKDAAEQYTKVVEMKPDGKYVKEAAYAAVLAWKNALNVDDHEQKELVEKDREKFEKKNDKKKMEPLTIPEYQKKMIGAFDTYIKYVPDAPELVTIKYRKARIFYEYNHFDEAVEAVRGHRQQAPEARAGGLLGEPAARLAERAGQDERRRQVRRQVPRDAGAHEGSGVRQADDLAEERHLRHRGHGLREAAQLQGVRPLDAGRRRGAARPPEARRAAVGRRRSASRTRTSSARRSRRGCS